MYNTCIYQQIHVVILVYKNNICQTKLHIAKKIFDKEGKFNIGDIEEFYLDFFSAALYLKHYAIINKLFGLPQLYQKNPQKKTNVFFFYLLNFPSLSNLIRIRNL
jgi:hypothetical protein